MTRLAVLNTRPSSQAAELSALLAAAGFLSVEAPAIRIVSGWEPETLAMLRNELRQGRFDWVVLASQNAGRDLDDLFAPTRVVCGARTAQALGVTPWLRLERFSAAAAVAALRNQVRAGDRVLLPRAAEGRDELAKGLAALGAQVSAPIAYRTVPDGAAARRLNQGDIDTVTVCSPSAAISVAPAITTERFVCLGETTAQVARANGLRVDAVASSTSMPALVAAIASLRETVNS